MTGDINLIHFTHRMTIKAGRRTSTHTSGAIIKHNFTVEIFSVFVTLSFQTHTRPFIFFFHAVLFDFK